MDVQPFVITGDILRGFFRLQGGHDPPWRLWVDLQTTVSVFRFSSDWSDALRLTTLINTCATPIIRSDPVLSGGGDFPFMFE